MQPELDGKRFGMVPAARMGEFYLAYHRYLKDNGVDGVKVGITATAIRIREALANLTWLRQCGVKVNVTAAYVFQT